MGLKIYWRAGHAHVRGTVAGQRIRQGLGTADPEHAEELRAALEAKIHKERIYGKEAVATFEDAALRYIERQRAEKGRSPRFLKPILAEFRGRRVGGITQGEIKDLALRLYPAASPATRRRQVITPTCAVINFVAKEYAWCQPIRIDYATGPKPKRKAISYDWVDAVRAECAKRDLWHLRALVLFMFQSGMRVGEAVRLDPSSFDPATGTLTAGRTKNGEPRTVKLTEELLADLVDLPAREGRLFGFTSEAGVRQGLRRVCPAAGVEYLATHQPGRHSFATFLMKAGMDPVARATAGGWKTVTIANDYSHADDASEKAAEMFDRHKSDTGRGASQQEDHVKPSISNVLKKEAVHEARPKFRAKSARQNGKTLA